MNAATRTPLEICAALLRDPLAIGREDPARVLPTHGPVLLAIAVVCTAIFGAVVGSYRGGAQLFFAAIKLPILWLLPLLVALPAARSLYRVCGVPIGYAHVVLAALVASARAALLLAVASPALWLAYSIQIDYHVAVVGFCAALVAAGIVGVSTSARVLPGRGAAKLAAHGMGAVALGVVLAQGGWILRPFIARPRAEVSLLRPIESNAFASVAATWRSARGRYDGWEIRREGLLSTPDASTQETHP